MSFPAQAHSSLMNRSHPSSVHPCQLARLALGHGFFNHPLPLGSPLAAPLAAVAAFFFLKTGGMHARVSAMPARSHIEQTAGTRRAVAAQPGPAVEFHRSRVFSGIQEWEVPCPARLGERKTRTRHSKPTSAAPHAGSGTATNWLIRNPTDINSVLGSRLMAGLINAEP